MKTGIIGAGRVGCSLGKYFRSKNADLVGYYDTNAAAAEEAAAFTQTAGFNQVQQLVRESDILFITTPDSLLVGILLTASSGSFIFVPQTGFAGIILLLIVSPIPRKKGDISFGRTNLQLRRSSII